MMAPTWIRFVTFDYQNDVISIFNQNHYILIIICIIIMVVIIAKIDYCHDHQCNQYYFQLLNDKLNDVSYA